MLLSNKTQNKKGGEPQYKENLGYSATFIDNNTSIVVDAFKGQGDSYKERETPQIRIQNNGNVIFEGTMEELTIKLKK